MSIGRVVRAVGGFFFVEPLEESTGIVECSVRGKMRITAEKILVGDKVTYIVENGKGVITGITDRETLLKRPYIANVNLLVLVFALKNPDPNDLLITKFLVLAEQSGIPTILVFNKADLVSENEAKQNVEKYRKYGYQVICTSVVTEQGKPELLAALNGKISVFSGPSGVGKSALLNMIAPGFKLQTGAVSEKIGRGRHTTREVQLLKLNESSYMADTPGFTQIAFDEIAPEQLPHLFPDFFEFEPLCRFHGCLHQAEPDCGVKQAVSDGAISRERYEIYLNLLREIDRNWKNRYR